MSKRKASRSPTKKASRKINMGNTSTSKTTNEDDESSTLVKGKHQPLNSLKDYGYCFRNEKLCSIDTNGPFEFRYFVDQEENQKRYEAIGKLIDEEIFEILEKECHLNRVELPIDAKQNEPTSFIFTSQNLQTADFIMMIIHGTGVVRAGQWSRKLIINEGLTVGSQIEYIRRAEKAGYAVIVTNTNFNRVESPRNLRSRSSRPIRGSETPEAHGKYVWEHFVRPNSAKHVFVMAHSYGGAVVLSIAEKFQQEFDQRVVAVALTDSPMKFYADRVKKKVLKMLKERTINWVVDEEKVDTELGETDCSSLRSAGHTVHEWTSHTSIDAIFNFFASKRSKLH